MRSCSFVVVRPAWRAMMPAWTNRSVTYAWKRVNKSTNTCFGLSSQATECRIVLAPRQIDRLRKLRYLASAATWRVSTADLLMPNTGLSRVSKPAWSSFFSASCISRETCFRASCPLIKTGRQIIQALIWHIELRSKRTKQGRRQDREYKYKQCILCSSFANQQPPIPPNDAHTCQLSALGETKRCSPRIQPTRSLATGANLLRKIINPPLARCFICAALDRA